MRCDNDRLSCWTAATTHLGSDAQAVTQTECVLLLLLEDVDVLQDVAEHLPRARQVVGALAARTDDDVTLVEVAHELDAGAVVDVVELRVADDALHVS